MTTNVEKLTTPLNRTQIDGVINDLVSLKPEVAEFEEWKAKRAALEAEIKSLVAEVATLRADRADAVKSQRFELENLQREIARVNDERTVALADLQRTQNDFAKLVVELKSLRKQLG